jgi:hypothetical protein
MEQEKHNGWSNYETWAVMLWIDNDRSLHEYFRGTGIRRLLKDASTSGEVLNGQLTPHEVSLLLVRITLGLKIERESPELGPTLYADLLAAAFAEVNWFEIAEELIKDGLRSSRVHADCPQCGQCSKVLEIGGMDWGCCTTHAKKWFLGPKHDVIPVMTHAQWRENFLSLVDFEDTSNVTPDSGKEAASHG